MEHCEPHIKRETRKNFAKTDLTDKKQLGFLLFLCYIVFQSKQLSHLCSENGQLLRESFEHLHSTLLKI